ncbi:MAG: phosphomannomutase, partial [Proteobacteria bacterium]|nr:phosphomannomutase [Pseudomonadota bacterium]
MNPDIFREYDIRGIAGKDMTEDDVIQIGKGVGTYLLQHDRSKLTVGRDCRGTSDLYAEKIIEGLLSTGCDVIDVGVCPTPVFYFSINHLKREGGVMITASHNPPEYNGFKLCIDLDSIHGKDIRKILDIINEKSFANGNGALSSADVVTPYKEFIDQNISISKPLKIGIDAGNGTAGVVAVPILKSLNCEVHDIYCDMDGTFPNHEADPTVEA